MFFLVQLRSFTLLFLMLCGFACRPAPPAGAPPTVQALSGSEFSGELEPGEQECYQIALQQGDFLELEVFRKSINLSLKLQGPGLYEVVADTPFSIRSKETLLAYAAETGIYELLVRAKGTSGGRYEGQVLNLHRANANERARAQAMLSLSQVQRDQEMSHDPERDFDRALATAKTADDPLLAGQTELLWALHCSASGQPDQAIKRFDRAGQHFVQGGALVKAAISFAEAGLPLMSENPARARVLLSLAEACAVSAGEADLALHFRCGLGFQLYREGLFQDAIGVYAQVLAERENRSDPVTTRAREEMAMCYKATGRTNFARDLFQQAHDYWASHQAPDFALRMSTEIGSTWYDEGLYDRAITSLRAARLGAQQLGDRAIEGGVCDRLGSAYREVQRYEEAEQAYLDALTLVAASRSQAGHVHANLAELYWKWGKLEACLAQVGQALSLFGHADQRFAQAHVIMISALAKRDLGQKEASLAALEQALALVAEAAASSGNRFGARYFSNSHFQYQLHYVEALLELWQSQQRDEFQEQAFQVIETVRAQELVTRLLEKSDQRQSDSTEARGLRQEIDQIEVKPSSDKSELRLRLAELELLEKSLQANRPSNNHLSADISRVQSSLLDPQTTLLAFTLGEKASYVWVVTQTSARPILLPSGKELCFQAHQLNRLWASPGEYLSEQAQALSQSLSQALLAPVLPYVQGTRLVLICDGPLQQTAFAALPLPDQPDQPLISRYSLVTLPSATVGLLLRQQDRSYPQTLLAFTDPVFGGDDPRLPSAGPGARGQYPRLDHSAREAKALAALVPTKQRQMFQGLGATREAFILHAQGETSIIHLALHGLLHERHPELSGLVFSCYDLQGPKDGILRAHTLTDLNLDANLVTLSGCRTALGREYLGEGTWSLGRDFMAAGAKRVLVSLWDVGDSPTADLMTVFYEGLLSQRLDPDVALQRAQNQMRLKFKDVYAWAPFTLQGDWRAFSLEPKQK